VQAGASEQRASPLPYVDPVAMSSGVMTVGSDVFGAGMTLFEMLSGSLVPRLDPAKASARLAKGQRAYPDGAFAYAPHVPSTVRRLVNKAIAPDLSKRFGTVAEMASAVAKAGRSVIDWSRLAGSGLDGEWRGTWPPTKALTKRRVYRVTSAAATTGRRAGTRHAMPVAVVARELGQPASSAEVGGSLPAKTSPRAARPLGEIRRGSFTVG
jgi:eukaryotic-like serine/threonine-protein kinase